MKKWSMSRFSADGARLRRFALLFALTAWTSSVMGGEPPSPAFSPDIHVTLSPNVFADHDVGAGPLSGGTKMYLGNLPDATDVDALHGLPNGDVLFSVDVPTVLEGNTYFPADVIRWNGLHWSREFESRANGVPDGVNLDAVALSGSILLFSIDVSAVLGGTYVTDSDVIAFDGEDYAVHMQASSVGIGTATDVDALHINDQGGMLVSLDITGSVPGVTFADEDVLLRANSSWSLNVDGSAANAAWIAADLDAWSSIFAADMIFADGFE